MHIVPARWRALVLVSALLGTAILAFGYLSDDEREGGDDPAVLPLVIVLLVSAVVGYLLWRKVAAGRAAGSAATPALVIGVLSILLGLFYWTGLVYFVAPVGIALGSSAGGDTRGRVGMALSAAGLAFAIVWGVVDAVL